MDEKLTTALSDLQIASSDLLASRALQKRVDDSYICSASELRDLLQLLSPHFHLVLSNDARWATYETMYFDTPDYSFFHQHRRGRRPRHKVRVRHYVERDLCFLETKTKDRYDVTTKHRKPRPSRRFDLDDEDLEVVRDAIGDVDELRQASFIRFTRVTLVGVEYEERFTIDFDIESTVGENSNVFHNVAVVEIKQPRFDARSPGVLALRELKIRPHSMSKYCSSMAALSSVDKTGKFLPTLRELERRSDA